MKKIGIEINSLDKFPKTKYPIDKPKKHITTSPMAMPLKFEKRLSFDILSGFVAIKVHPVGLTHCAQNILSKNEIFFEFTFIFKKAERTMNKVLTLAKKILVNIRIKEAPEEINVTNKIIAGMLHKNNIDATATKKSKLDSNANAPKPIIAEPIAKPGRPKPFFNPFLNAIFIIIFYHYVFAIKSISIEAPTASPVTPIHVLAGNLSSEKYVSYILLTISKS